MSRKFYRLSSNSSVDDDTANTPTTSGGGIAVVAATRGGLLSVGALEDSAGGNGGSNSNSPVLHTTASPMSDGHSSSSYLAQRSVSPPLVENTRSYELNFNQQKKNKPPISQKAQSASAITTSSSSSSSHQQQEEAPSMIPKIIPYSSKGSRIEINLRYFVAAATSFLSQLPKGGASANTNSASSTKPVTPPTGGGGGGSQKRKDTAEVRVPPLLGGAKSVPALETMLREAHEVLSLIKRSSPTGGGGSNGVPTAGAPSPPRPDVLQSESFARADDDAKRRALSPDWCSSGTMMTEVPGDNNLSPPSRYRSVSPSSISTAMMSSSSNTSSAQQAVPISTHVSEAVKYITGACRALPAKSIFLLEQAALMENSLLAKTELSLCLLYGHGCHPNIPRALQLLDECVASGHPAAMLAVGKCLRDGVGVSTDVNGALTWICRAAQLEYLPAMHELGEMFEDGLTVRTPPRRVTGGSNTPPQQGDDSGNNSSGNRSKNLNQRPLPPTPPASSTRGGNSGSSSQQEDNTHLEKDLVQSLRWYKAAASKGYPPAQLNLAKLYLLTMQMAASRAHQQQQQSQYSEYELEQHGDEESEGHVPAYGEAELKAAYWLKLAASNGLMEAKGLLERLNLPQ